MRPWVLLLLPPILAAQPPVVRGVLLDRDMHTGGGEFSVRAPDDQVYRYQYDNKTYVEREDKMTDIEGLRPGERVEVVSDKLPGSAWRYARSVHVIENPPPQRRPAALRRLDAYFSLADRVVPMGDLTFSGVVFRLNGDRLVLHTRKGDQTLLLGPDTRYLANGVVVDAAALKPNMRVFVRAGKGLYGDDEAYQVIWGSILMPQ